MHRAVSVERGYFLPLISRVAGLGRCLLGLDKDAVCGPLLGACVAACVHRPDPTREGGRGGWGGGGYIHTLVTPVQPGKHGDIPELFSWLDVGSVINLHMVERISHWCTSFLCCFIRL